MTTSTPTPEGRARVVVMLSGAGSTMRAVLEAAVDPSYPAEVVAVCSDLADAGGLRVAAQFGIPTFTVGLTDFPDREAWATQLVTRIDEYRPDLVLSAGFMRILPASFVDHFSPRLINSHPALLPAFPGAHAVKDALAYGAKVTGVTVHVVDAGVDTGPIIAQRPVDVHEGDSVESLHERIKQTERELLVSVVGRAAGADISISGREVTLT